MFKISLHVIDHYRSLERRREVSVGLATDLEGHDSDVFSLSESDKAELAGCLRPMIERLSVEYREAIRIAELQGLTHQHAASQLGRSVFKSRPSANFSRDIPSFPMSR